MHHNAAPFLRNLILSATAAVLLAGCAVSPAPPPLPVVTPSMPPAQGYGRSMYDVRVVVPTPAPAPVCHETAYAEEGEASWYGPRYHGRATASGEPFDMDALTAAHPALPFGTLLRVTNLANGLSVMVTVNDRGPRVRRRIVDLSQRAAADLDMIQAGIVPVRIAAVRCG